jgi:hypothetical protein
MYQGLPFFATTFPGVVAADDEQKKKYGQIAKQVFINTSRIADEVIIFIS